MNMGITGNFKMRFIGRPEGKLMKNAPGNFEHGKIYVVPYGHSKFKFWEMIDPEPKLVVPESTESFEEAFYVPKDEELFEDTTYVPSELEEDPWSYTTSEPIVEEIRVPEPVVEEVPEPVVEVAPVSAPVDTRAERVIDNSAPATIEPYMTFNPMSGELSSHKEELVALNRGEPVLTEEEKKQKMIADLQAQLAQLTEAPVSPLADVDVEMTSETMNRDGLLAVLKDAGREVKPRTRTTTLRKMVADLEKED